MTNDTRPDMMDVHKSETVGPLTVTDSGELILEVSGVKLNGGAPAAVILKGRKRGAVQRIRLTSIARWSLAARPAPTTSARPTTLWTSSPTCGREWRTRWPSWRRRPQMGRGSVVTPHGPIHASWRRSASGALEIECIAPAECRRVEQTEIGKV